MAFQKKAPAIQIRIGGNGNGRNGGARAVQPDVQGPPGKTKKQIPPLRKPMPAKANKAPPPRKGDHGASETNKLARQVSDRLRQRDKQRFPIEE